MGTLKVYVSVDMEGITGLVDAEGLFNLFLRVATAITTNPPYC
jgi:D-aminopeptidase